MEMSKVAHMKSTHYHRESHARTCLSILDTLVAQVVSDISSVGPIGRKRPLIIAAANLRSLSHLFDILATYAILEAPEFIHTSKRGLERSA